MVELAKCHFRFATDDPENPKKVRVLHKNHHEHEQFELAFEDSCLPDTDTKISKWRWYIEKAHQEEDSPSVSFVGLNENNERLCSWEYDETTTLIHSIDGSTPEAKPISEAPVKLPAAKISIKKIDT